MAVEPAAGTALRRVIVTGGRGGIVQRNPDRDHVGVLPAHSQPERDLLDCLDCVALCLRLAGDAAQVPRLVRQRDDAPHRALGVLVAAAADETSERLLVSTPDPLQATTGRGGKARLVSRPPVLVEVDPTSVRRDLNEPRDEAGAADLDVARGHRDRDQGETVLVLLTP